MYIYIYIRIYISININAYLFWRFPLLWSFVASGMLLSNRERGREKQKRQTERKGERLILRKREACILC